MLLLTTLGACFAHNVACQISWLPDREPIMVPASDIQICAREQYFNSLHCRPTTATTNCSGMDQQHFQSITEQTYAFQEHLRTIYINDTPLDSSPSE